MVNFTEELNIVSNYANKKYSYWCYKLGLLHSTSIKSQNNRQDSKTSSKIVSNVIRHYNWPRNIK